MKKIDCRSPTPVSSPVPVQEEERERDSSFIDHNSKTDCGSPYTVRTTTAVQVEEKKRDYSSIDQHVRMIPKTAETSLENLSEYLIGPAKDNIDKARAIYVWVCENISLADLQCKMIMGYSKGYSFKPGTVLSYEYPISHAWNVIYVENKWQFVESTWGSGYLDKKGTYVNQFTDFYFLTSPENFIKEHFPYIDEDKVESRKWQLLERPITLRQFSRAAKPERKAMEWNLEFPDTPFQIIESNSSFEFRILCKIYDLVVVDGTLYNSSGYSQRDTVVTSNHSSYITVHVKPKTKGEYRLRIFGNIEQSNSLPMLIAYTVKYVPTRKARKQIN